MIRNSICCNIYWCKFNPFSTTFFMLFNIIVETQSHLFFNKEEEVVSTIFSWLIRAISSTFIRLNFTVTRQDNFLFLKVSSGGQRELVKGKRFE